jgi:hypothetical protein
MLDHIFHHNFDHTFKLTLSTPQDDEQPCLVGVDIIELVRPEAEDCGVLDYRYELFDPQGCARADWERYVTPNFLSCLRANLDEVLQEY